jgi:GNAT superfamily N-acetyltransferase
MIRRCTASDVEQIFAVINDAAEAYRNVIPADRWHEPYMPLRELESEIESGVGFWAVLEGERIEAVMGIQPVKDVALIRHAYTRTASQGRGLGAELLTFLRAMTERPILIGTWRSATWAIRFYQRHGFRLVTPDEKVVLLRRYWTIPDRQIEESVVLADERWFSRTAESAAATDTPGLTRVEEAGVAFLEGVPDQRLLSAPGEANRIIEACFSHHTRRVVLYASNMTAGFFDVSSGHAGDILQRLRTYGVRLAVVCPSGIVNFSSRFDALMNDERRHGFFAAFETRDAAVAWLASRQAPGSGL